MSGVWASVWITLAIQALVSLVVFTPPVLAPPAQADIGVSASSVGIVTALIYLSATFGALLSARLIARHGPMRMSQCSLLLAGAGVALMTTANVFLVALGALVIGLGYGQVTPSSSAILAERAPERLRAFIFSLKQTGVPIGGAVAGAMLPALIHALGWKVAALVTGGVCVVLAIALQPMRAGVDRGSRARGRAAPCRPARAAAARDVARAAARDGIRIVHLLGHADVPGLVPGGIPARAGGLRAGRGGGGFVHRDDRRHRRAHCVGCGGGQLAASLGCCSAGSGWAWRLAAFMTALISSSWPAAAVFVVSFVYGATAVGWNGVYLSEVARIAPPGRAAAATGASLAMTYSGVMVLPTLFWAIVALAAAMPPLSWLPAC